MKSWLFPLLLAFLLGLWVSTASAKDVSIHACTQDGYGVVLFIDLADDTRLPVQEHIAKLFRDVASTLTAAELLSEIGSDAFLSKLDDEEQVALLRIYGPPLADDNKCTTVD